MTADKPKGVVGLLFPMDFPQSIRKYVQIRRAIPGFDISIAEAEGIRTAIVKECEPFGIAPDLIDAACSPDRDYPHELGHDKAVDELALQLLEVIIKRDDLKRSGAAHLTRAHAQMSDSLINELALTMLEACSDIMDGLPISLTVLLRAQLGLLGNRAFLSKKYLQKDLAALLLRSDANLSARKIAETIGVKHTTVARWLKQPEFHELVESKAPIIPIEKLIPVIKGAAAKSKT